MSGRRTALHEHYRKKRHNHRVVFGQPIRHVRRGWRSRFAVFESGQVFGYERWFGDKYGTQSWILYIGKTVEGGHFTCAPGIKPGADIWLIAKGKTQIKRLFEALDAMKKVGLAPVNVAEHRWREIQLALGRMGDPASVVASWQC